jgi:large subunit ribosomal protein L1
MGSKRNVTVDGGEDKVKIVSGEAAAKTENKAAASETVVAKVVKKTARSPKYQAARAKVDRTKFYPLAEAIELVKQISYTKFVSTISLDLTLKEVESQIKVNFPHTTGRALRVAVVDEPLLAEIKEGKMDFDVLLTTPQYMPQLAKLARILGPKGLMPNPKNGTIVADPEKAKAELLGGKTILKTEKKAPLLHVTLGKTSMPTTELVENAEALMKVVGGRVVKVVVSATMSPGVKILL